MRTPAFKERRAIPSRSAWFADQDASEDVARPRVERLEARAEVGVVIHRHPSGAFGEVRGIVAHSEWPSEGLLAKKSTAATRNQTGLGEWHQSNRDDCDRDRQVLREERVADGICQRSPRMSAAATRTDRASHGLPGERVLADRGRVRELAR